MEIRAYAKINLLLDILGKTDDDYHSIFMIMQSIGIYDEVTVELEGRANQINLTCSNPALPTDKSNIAHKAAKAFFDYYNKQGLNPSKTNPGIKIHIEKNIPFAAGLAGGSADAAAVIFGLNEILNAGLTTEELCAIGVKVGADVPFCIKGGTMVALDIGQVLAPLPPIKDKYIVLVKPDQSVSTKEAYDAFDTASNIRHCNTSAMVHALANNLDFCPYVQNVFEQFVEVPDRVEIKSVLRAYNAKATCMSGTGPSVYGIFDNETKARSCANALRDKFKNTFFITPVNKGLEIL